MAFLISQTLILAGLLAAGALAQGFDEYRVKTAFLYNFVKFVEWPDDAFQSAKDPIAICMIGYDPQRRALEDLVRGKAIQGRAIVVRQVSNAEQAKICQVLF